MIRRSFLWFAVIWCGAATMGFELVGARLLMPSFGMGIDVWASVIAITLGALAAGYWIGGRVSAARASLSALGAVHFLSSSALFLVWLSAPAATGAFEGMSQGLWASALLLLAPPLFFLGCVSPVAASLLAGSGPAFGKLYGGLLAASTLGGVAATVLTGLFLLPGIGVSATLLGLSAGAALLAVVSFVLARRARTGAALLLVTVAAACLAPSHTGEGPDKLLERVDSLYGRLEVLEEGGSRFLFSDGILQTASSPSASRRGALIRGQDYFELVPYFRPAARKALILGLGGGLHERMLALHGVAARCVEIDRAVVDIAARYFGLGSETIVADARAFLVHDTMLYDVILLDVFLGNSIPEHLYTREAFQRMADRLEPDGLLALHILGHPGHPAARAVARTLEAVFPHVQAAAWGRGRPLEHLFLFASRGPLELYRLTELESFGWTGEAFCRIESSGAPILTDDRTCLSILSRDVVASWRRASSRERRIP